VKARTKSCKCDRTFYRFQGSLVPGYWEGTACKCCGASGDEECKHGKRKIIQGGYDPRAIVLRASPHPKVTAKRIVAVLKRMGAV